MALIAGNITALLSFKLKARHDDYTDQVSRICVVKILIVSSLVMAVDWFYDSVSCLGPKSQHLYLESACWIKGFYVYPDLPINQSAYYGIPNVLNVNGWSSQSKEYCGILNRFDEPTKHCKPLKKRYLKQYQWMPFCVATMSLLFYLPYIIYRVVNTDMISLRANLMDKVSNEEILSNYFNHKINSLTKMRIRVLLNFFIKCLYVFSNFVTFYILNSSLDHEFDTFGSDWIKWKKMNISQQMKLEKELPHPGEKLLPTFGLCEVTDTRMESTRLYKNKLKMVCEISTHVLYHYVFLILWFVLLISFALSCMGVLLNIGSCINNYRLSLAKTPDNIYRHLTIRECEYLVFIRRKNLAEYGTIVKNLQRRRKKSKNGDFKREGSNSGNIQNHHKLSPLTDTILSIQ